MGNICVCIVEDNNDIRQALEQIIMMADGYQFCGSFISAESAIIGIPKIKPNVVLMDINLGGMSGIDCVRELKPRFPDVLFMMCTVYEEDEKIFEALSAGASGYILKKTTPSKMLDAIRELYEGGAPMSSQIARKVVAAFLNRPASNGGSELATLTNREREILEFLSRGMMYKEIALALNLANDTIRKHVYHVYEKLHVTNRVEAVNKFFGR